MSRAAILLLVLLSGCSERDQESHGERGDDGMKQIGSWVFLDTKTGCEWIALGEHTIPRIDADGNQVCRRLK